MKTSNINVGDINTSERKEGRAELMSQSDRFSKHARKFIDTFELSHVSAATGCSKSYIQRELIACSTHTDSLSLQTLDNSCCGFIKKKGDSIISTVVTANPSAAKDH